MSDIPTEIKKWLAEQGVGNYNLVEYNPRKGRWCISFIDNTNRQLFLKWNEQDNQHVAYYYSMVREEKIYKSLQQYSITPKYIGGGQFVTECISNPQTLREYIKERVKLNDDPALFFVVTQAIQKWQEYIASSNIDFLTFCEPKCEYERYLYSTLLACPMNTVMGPYEKKRNEYILLIFEKFLNKKINKLLHNDELVFQKTHGDFHLNNILTDDNGNLFLIDFEDSKICLPEIELAYFMSQVHVLLRNNSKVEYKIKKFVDENVKVLSDKSLYRKVLRLYYYTIKFNHAFQ